MTILGLAEWGTKVQVRQEINVSTFESIASCAASTCDSGLTSEATERAKAEEGDNNFVSRIEEIGGIRET